MKTIIRGAIGFLEGDKERKATGRDRSQNKFYPVTLEVAGSILSPKAARTALEAIVPDGATLHEYMDLEYYGN